MSSASILQGLPPACQSFQQRHCFAPNLSASRFPESQQAPADSLQSLLSLSPPILAATTEGSLSIPAPAKALDQLQARKDVLEPEPRGCLWLVWELGFSLLLQIWGEGSKIFYEARATHVCSLLTDSHVVPGQEEPRKFSDIMVAI